MSDDILKQLQDACDTFVLGPGTLFYEAAAEIARLREYARAAGAVKVRELIRQLRSLAVALHAKHFAEDAPGWQPLDDAEGILSQIDNMTAGLSRPTEQDVPLWSALQFYADGETDGGLRARSALHPATLSALVTAAPSPPTEKHNAG